MNVCPAGGGMREADKETGVQRFIPNRKTRTPRRGYAGVRFDRWVRCINELQAGRWAQIIQVFGVLEKSLALAPSFLAMLYSQMHSQLSLPSNVKVEAVQHEVAVFPFNRICKPHSPVSCAELTGFWNGEDCRQVVEVEGEADAVC